MPFTHNSVPKLSGPFFHAYLLLNSAVIMQKLHYSNKQTEFQVLFIHLRMFTDFDDIYSA